jgi:hypothetical protein
MTRLSRRVCATLVLLTISVFSLWAGSAVSADDDNGNDNGESAWADFNGDGFSDLAVGTCCEDVAGAADAGAINVIYGSEDGLTAEGNQFITQNTPGVPDSAEEGDNFSWWLSSADFNGDGYGDLAAGAGGEDVDGVTDAGAVHVLYGSAGGLTGRGSDYFTENTAGISDEAEEADCFGCTTGGGDLDGDGYAELLVGVQAEDVGGAEDAGAIHIIHGSADGVTGEWEEYLTQDSRDVADSAEAGDNFGWVFATGDFGGSKHNDLAVGVPFEDVGGAGDAGGVHVFPSSGEGISTEGDRLWTQNSRGVRDKAEEGDAFGSNAITADVIGDEHADLIVAAPAEDWRGAADAGAVSIIAGSQEGLTGQDDEFWTQDSPGVRDKAEEGDRFGDGLAAGDFGRGRHIDLAVGADTEDVAGVLDAGGVNVMYGTPGGITGFGGQFWTQKSPGVADKPEPTPEEVFGETFGYLLFAADFGRSPHADLAITVPGENIGGADGAGAAHVLYGSGKGLTARGAQFWHQNRPGIKDEAEEFDFWGVFLGTPT